VEFPEIKENRLRPHGPRKGQLKTVKRSGNVNEGRAKQHPKISIPDWSQKSAGTGPTKKGHKTQKVCKKTDSTPKEPTKPAKPTHQDRKKESACCPVESRWELPVHGERGGGAAYTKKSGVKKSV